MSRLYKVSRPLLVGYLVVLGLILGIMVDRRPETAQQAVPAIAMGRTPASGTDGPSLYPVWRELFKPSVGTAKVMFRRTVPMLSLVDRWEGGGLNPRRMARLVVYAATDADLASPQSLLNRQIPYLRPIPGYKESGQGSEPNVPNPQGLGDQPSPGPQPPSSPDVQPPPETPPNLGTDPLVGIYSTHDYESYISEIPVGAKRTETNDSEKNIIQVAKTLAKALQKRGIGVVHSPASHQEEGYLGAYTVSRDTAKFIVQKYPSVKILLDVHRDEGDRNSDTVTKINGVDVAKVMLVVGVGDRDVPQRYWEQTLAFSRSIAAVMDEKYPGLFRKITTKPGRYNQDLMPASVILEIGADGNRMDEALRAAELVADVLAEVIKRGGFPVSQPTNG